MDITQAKSVIEIILNSILTSAPDAILNLEKILQLIANGIRSVGTLGVLISQNPAFAQLAQKLLYLLNSGISVHEIAISLTQFATNLGLPLELLIQFLQIVSGLIAVF
ncbi:hypothetical protein NIES4071_60150 [Calothrix sp. NIES-4071]|nr:hypothetical protein NIES4071_60150 [Calothrix sp. NIES-4071]BAZ60322.1 hypothetical protein NIES4105_60100 [Calothrix sp. NIES-4105]